MCNLGHVTLARMVKDAFLPIIRDGNPHFNGNWELSYVEALVSIGAGLVSWTRPTLVSRTVAGLAAAEELAAHEGAVDELVGQQKLQRAVLFLQRSHSAEREDVIHP